LIAPSGKAATGSGRRQASAWGILLAYASAITAVMRNLLLVPVYLHFVPLAQYGAWLATGASLVQIVVTDYGLAGVLMQRASTAHGAGAHEELGPLIRTGLLAAAGASLVLSCISIAIVPLLLTTGKLLSSGDERLTYCILLAVLANAIGIVGTTAQGFVRSLQRARLSGLVTLLADLMNIAATVVLLIAGFGLYALAVGLVVRSVLMSVVLVSYLFHKYKPATKVPFPQQWQLLKSLFSDSWHSLILSLSMKVQTQGNTFFVGALLGPQSAAAYGLTVRAHETFLMFLSLANNAFVPSMAHLIGSGNQRRFKELLLRVVPALILFSALGMVVTVGENQSFVSLWVGRAVFAGQGVSILAAVAILVATLGYASYDALYALGQFRVIARTFFFTALLHVGLLISLIRFGLWVVPLVSIASASIWGSVFVRHAASAIELRRYEAKRVAGDLLWITLCSCLVAAAFIALPEARHWLSLAGSASLCAGSFLLAVLGIRKGLRVMIREEFATTVRSMFRRP
jgi:teichuronic acid exporter